MTELPYKEAHHDYVTLVGRLKLYYPDYNKKYQSSIDNYFEQYLTHSDISFPITHLYTRASWDAIYDNFSRFNIPVPYVDENLVLICLDWSLKEFSFMKNSEIISFSQCAQFMERTSSPGFPFNLKYFSKGDLLDNCGSQLLSYMDDFESTIDQGPATYFKGSFKHELRKMSKIMSDEVRVFVMGSIEHLFLSMKYFYHMNSKLYDNAGRCASFLGGSKFRRGFDFVFRRLNRHPNAYELDESAYDSTIPPIFLFSMLFFRYHCLNSVYRTKKTWDTLCWIYNSLIRSYVVMDDGFIFMKEIGIPSGVFTTSTDGTIVLFQLLCYAWLKLAPPSLRTFKAFRKHCEMIINGDDNNWTVSNYCHSFFNVTTVSKIWCSIGINAKFDFVMSRSIFDTVFLSNRVCAMTRYGQTVYVPYPDREKLMCTMYFTKTRNTRIFTNITFSYIKACSLYIEAFYNLSFRPIISGFIEFLERNYYDEIHFNAFSCHFSEMEIENLYLGLQCNLISRAEENCMFSAIADRFSKNLKLARADFIDNFLDSGFHSDNDINNFYYYNSEMPRNPKLKKVAPNAKVVINEIKQQPKKKRGKSMARKKQVVFNVATRSRPRRRNPRLNKAAPLTAFNSQVVRPLRITSVVNTRLGQGIRLRGSEIVGNLTAVGTASGNIVTVLPINPTSIGSSRLAQISASFDRFWFHNISFTIHTGLPTTATGSMVGYFDPDPGDSILNIPISERLRGASAHAQAHEFAVWQPSISFVSPYNQQITKANSVVNDLLYINTNDDPRFCNQGSFNLLVSNTLSTTALGSLWVTYDCSLYFPQDGQLQSQNINNTFGYSASVAGYSSAAPLGSSPVLNPQSTFTPRLTPTDSSFLRLSLPVAGTWMIFVAYGASTTTAWYNNFNAVNNQDTNAIYTVTNRYGSFGTATAQSGAIVLGVHAVFQVVISGIPVNSNNYLNWQGAGTSKTDNSAYAYMYGFSVPSAFSFRRSYIDRIFDSKIEEIRKEFKEEKKEVIMLSP